SVYLCICMPHGISIMKWAPQPFYKFMALKDLPITGVTSIDVIEVPDHGRPVTKVVIGHEGRFKILDIEEIAVDNVRMPEGVAENRAGRAIKGVAIGTDSVVLCHNHVGLVSKLDRLKDEKKTRAIQWRAPMCFATRIGDDFVVAGSSSVVDVFQVSTGKLVHVFETRKEKVKSLNHLFHRDKYLYLLVEETRDGKEFSSIIQIVQEWAPYTP
ncbi:hypothetical protein DFJ74DRAFT_608746, partial [Hyaloraphidium curvatum]